MLYLDTSAFLKLVVAEVHSDVLRMAVASETGWSSSLLEIGRAHV